MLGTNKSWKTMRLQGDSYQDNIKQVKFRYEPIKYKEYNTKAKHIAFMYYSDVIDLVSSDRIVDTSNNDREFVVAGNAVFTDTLWKHLEVMIREVNSKMHEPVIQKVLSDTQANYDPIYEERHADKNYGDKTINVLIDPMESARESFIKIMEIWKLEEVDLIMTVDFPDKVDKADRIIRDNIEYEIKRVVTHPYQYLVWLRKSMVNYINK